jgi:hypothetical protein
MDLYSLFEFLGKIVNPLHHFSEFKAKIADPLKNNGRQKIAFARLSVRFLSPFCCPSEADADGDEQIVLKAVMLRRRKTDTVDGKPLIVLPAREIIEVKSPFLNKCVLSLLHLSLLASADAFFTRRDEAEFYKVRVCTAPFFPRARC